ncbi:hypothetical protein J6590_033256 [Homalodisca vitripennis]|nr:hypothetical protein J6590_033256 [Homalodisca vitripennis]
MITFYRSKSSFNSKNLADFIDTPECVEIRGVLSPCTSGIKKHILEIALKFELRSCDSSFPPHPKFVQCDMMLENW